MNEQFYRRHHAWKQEDKIDRNAPSNTLSKFIPMISTGCEENGRPEVALLDENGTSLTKLEKC